MQIPGGGGWSGLKLTDTLIPHPFRGVLGLIPFPKAVKYSINSYFDVLLDNAFKVEKKVKYKSDLEITGSCLQWNISRCAVTKGTVVLKSVMLLILLFFQHQDCLSSPEFMEHNFSFLLKT